MAKPGPSKTGSQEEENRKRVQALLPLKRLAWRLQSCRLLSEFMLVLLVKEELFFFFSFHLTSSKFVSKLLVKSGNAKHSEVATGRHRGEQRISLWQELHVHMAAMLHPSQAVVLARPKLAETVQSICVVDRRNRSASFQLSPSAFRTISLWALHTHGYVR